MNLQEALINANIATEEQINKVKENAAIKYMAVVSDGFYTWVKKFTNEKDAKMYYENNKAWEEIEMFKIEPVQF